MEIIFNCTIIVYFSATELFVFRTPIELWSIYYITKFVVCQ